MMTSLAVREALLDAWALLSPVGCAGCGAVDRALCAVCGLALVPRLTTTVLPSGLSVVSALSYAGTARRAILALKEHGRSDVARSLSPAFAVAVRSAAAQSPVDGSFELTSIPSSRAALRRRGYDPVGVLAKRARLPRLATTLARERSTATQKSLHLEARRANANGSMRARTPLHDRRFVLVDDVLTTGATIDEAVRAIRAAGGEVVAAATLARTPKLFPDSSARASTGYSPGSL